ncbi:MAG: DNA translocase FtsK 4TM domain-containing protein [Chloroflexi bacterium]|nr:DNA translocase FtsK 4TM domain-containing protein [Chloroflexota bacterium]
MFNRLFNRNKPESRRGKGKSKARGGKKSGAMMPPSAPPPQSAPTPEAPPPPKGLSLDQKLDIVGILLILGGILILLALFSPANSSITAPVLKLLSQLFGYGKYLVPVGLIILGLWIVLRHFGDKLPRIAPERVMGWIGVYLISLITLHFIIAPDTSSLMKLAEEGNGGGYIGAYLLKMLFDSLGQAGSVVVVMAGWIIGLILGAGITTQQIVDAIKFVTDRLPKPKVVIGEQLPLPNVPPVQTSTAAPAAAATPPPAPAAESESKSVSKSPLKTPTVTAKKPKQGSKEESASPDQKAESKSSQPAPVYDQPIIIGGHQPWVLPKATEMLEAGTESGADDDYDRQRAHVIEDTLNSFGAPVRVVEINRGPTITQFGVEPDFVDVRGKKTKVKVGKISALSDDLALALAAPSIRIEAPVPGKGYVGVEVPNTHTNLVSLRDVMESDAFRKIKTTLGLALGQDVSGQAICGDLTNMPHLLIAGTTGSGKSVCVNSIICALLIQNTPDDLKFLMVDPKRVELTSYNNIPHLLVPVIVDMERVVGSLQWVTREMDERYRKFAKAGTRNIVDYNTRIGKEAEKKLPYLVVIIDELADLMMLAPDETERTITRLAQMARATGIHLIIATQRPSVDVVTGLIKANFPARIAFAVASSIDSRVILDQPGAEKLLGRGDMLLQSPDTGQPLRMQGVFVSDVEIQRLVRYWKGARGMDVDSDESPQPQAVASAPMTPGAPTPIQTPMWEEDNGSKSDSEDDLFDESVKVVREMRKASITLLQRRLRIGYTRAAKLIDELEEKGIVGPAKSGAQQREVLGLDIDPTKPEPAETSEWAKEE